MLHWIFPDIWKTLSTVFQVLLVHFLELNLYVSPCFIAVPILY